MMRRRRRATLWSLELSTIRVSMTDLELKTSQRFSFPRLRAEVARLSIHGMRTPGKNPVRN